MKKEINCDQILFDDNVDKFLIYKSQPNHKLLGLRLGVNYQKDVI